MVYSNVVEWQLPMNAFAYLSSPMRPRPGRPIVSTPNLADSAWDLGRRPADKYMYTRRSRSPSYLLTYIRFHFVLEHQSQIPRLIGVSCGAHSTYCFSSLHPP